MQINVSFTLGLKIYVIVLNAIGHVIVATPSSDDVH